MRRRGLWITIGVLAFLFLALQAAARITYRERLPADRSRFTHTDVVRAARAEASPRRLVVLFHGSSGRDLPDVFSAIAEALPGADILAPGYSSSFLSNEDPLNLTREFLASIDDAMAGGQYDRITFVGYSLGALLGRKVLVCAYTGCVTDYGGRESARSWRSRVDRIVLLAGMNRGWATRCEKVVAVEQAGGVGYDNDCRARNMRWSQWLGAEVGSRLAEVFGVGRLILSTRKGEPFVANLRLESLELKRLNEPLPPVVQLLGDIDEVVSRDDNLDHFVAADFVFLQLRRTNHANVVQMSGPDGGQRRSRFIEALTWPVDQLRTTYPQPPNPEYTPRPDVRKVVMIVHGIRDDGRWADELGREFQSADPSLRAFSRSYGYFSALYFLLPARMDANVRWFVDQYTQLRALHPNAEFHVVGHSNGTYMVAQSLRRYHAVTFKRAVFAGSVVQTGFPWSNYRGRIEAIRNYRASNDVVVAALPSVFEYVRGFLQVGGAGHAGFTDELARRTESRYFATGGHSAVLDRREKYAMLVNYVLGRGCAADAEECEAWELPAAYRSSRQSWNAVLLYKFSVIVWAAAILGVGGAAYGVSRVVRPNRRKHSTRGYVIRSAVAGCAVFGAVILVLRFV